MGYLETKKENCKTQIIITRAIEDEDYSGTPEDKDEGFWPSLDANSPGYIGANPEVSFEEQKRKAEIRLYNFNEGVWNYVGVRAVAHVSIDIGGGSICTYKLKSAGLWGIESDSEESYLQEVFEEQAEELKAHIAAMATAPVTIVKED